MAEYVMEKVLFTDHEKVTMAERIAEIHKDVSLLESEAKNIKSNYKSKIDELETEGKGLMWKIHDGYEMVMPKQSELPGFTDGAEDQLSDVIDDETVDPIERDNKRLKKAFKGILAKVPTMPTIATYTDEEFENALAWAEDPTTFDKPVFLGE